MFGQNQNTKYLYKQLKRLEIFIKKFLIYLTNFNDFLDDRVYKQDFL